MNAEKPTVLIIGPRGDGAVEIMEQFLIALGVAGRLCHSAEEAVDLAISGQASAVIYREAADLTGPETFEAIRWGYSLAGFIYLYNDGDLLKDRIIEDVRARVAKIPCSLRQLKGLVETVSPACKLAFEAGKAPA